MAKVGERQLSLGGRLGYAIGIYGVFLAWMTVALYLLYFYTDVMGLSLAHAGLIFLIASVWDAVTDPLMGWLIERGRSRWGKYRPYLLFAALYYVPDLEGNNLFVWAPVTSTVLPFSRSTLLSRCHGAARFPVLRHHDGFLLTIEP